MEKQKGRRAYIWRNLLLLILGIFYFSTNEVQAGIASSYTDAREFYESTGVEKPYHADENAGCIYFATQAKLATHEGRKYATIGYDIALSAGGKTVSFRVKRNGEGSVQEVPGSRREYKGYEYNLYELSEKELMRLAHISNHADAAVICESPWIKVQIDAIMTIKENNILLGDVREDGAGGLIETGNTNQIYYLKNEEEWNALKSVFPNHNFFSFRKIELNLSNYSLYVSYDLAGGTVSDNYSVKDDILYQNNKRYVTCATILQEIQLLKPETIDLQKTGFHIEKKKEWKTAETENIYSARKKYLPKEIYAGIGEGNHGVVMVANWQANTYHIEYDVNGGLGVFQKQKTEYGKSELLHKIVPQKSGSVFAGWKCDGVKCKNCKNSILHEPGETVKNLTDIHGATVKLTAQWENKMVQIKTDKQQGKNGTNIFFEKYGIDWYADKKGTSLLSTITIPGLLGYRFAGYYTGMQGNGKQIVDKSGVIVAEADTFMEDSIIYANWEPAKYNITFKKHGGVGGQNGGIQDDVVEAFYMKALPEIPAVARKGYSFRGYYTEENGAGEAYYDQYQNGLQFYAKTEDMTLHAYWVDDVAPEVNLTASPVNWTNHTSGVQIKGIVQDQGVGLEKVILYSGKEALEKNKIKEVRLTNLEDTSLYVLEYVHNTEGIQNYTLQAIDKNGNVAQAGTVAYYDITAPTGNMISETWDNANGILGLELFVTDYNKSDLYQYTREHLTDREVRIAVIDTGFEKSKLKDVKIEERIVDQGQNFSNSGVENDIQDDNGHGTRLINLILEETPENIKILPIKAADINGESTIYAAYRAVQEAINEKVDVILISMNGPKGNNNLLRQAIKEAREQDIAVVVSAGNYGQDVSGYAPANIPEAIVVSAIEAGTHAAYSNYGELVDFCADGTYKTTDDQGKEIILQGTSIAAARVAAQLAGMKTFLSETDRMEEILNHYVQDMGKAGKDVYYGRGYIGEFKIDTFARQEASIEKENMEFDVENKNISVNVNHNHRKSEENILNIQFLKKTGYFKIRIDTPEGWIRYKVTTTVKNTSETAAQIMTYTVTEDKKSASNYTQQFQINLTHTSNVKDPYGNYNMFQATLKITPKGDSTTQTLKGYHLEKDSETPIYVVNGQSHCGQGEISENAVDILLGSNSLGLNNGCGCKDCHVTFRYVYTENVYKITYDKQGGTGTLPDGSVTYNEYYTLPATGITKIGHTFQGYYLKRPNGNVWGGSTNGWVKNTETEKFVLYQPAEKTKFGINIGAPTENGGTFTYVAVWKKNQYTIAYQANGGSGTVTGEVIDYNTSHTVNSVEHFQWEGHTFAGYYIKRGSDGKVLYKNGSTYEWLEESKNQYTVYKPGDGQNFGPKMVRTDLSLATDTFTFVAIWKRNTYTVTYQVNGGKIKENGTVRTTRTVGWGEDIPLDLEVIPDDSNNTFIGWGLENTNAPCSSLKMGQDGIKGNITLYALYSPPVSDVEEVYLIIKDTTGKYSRNGKEYEKILLTKTKTVAHPVKGYNYKLNRISYKDLFPDSQLSKLELGIYARDFAGNTRLLWGSDLHIPEYTQIVEHLFQNLDQGKDTYDKIGLVQQKVLKGDTYTPVALSEIPMGYQVNEEKSGELNKAYTVTGEKTTAIYYDAIGYTLTFDANQGQIEGKPAGETVSKTVYYEKPYGYLPGSKDKKSTVESFPTVTRKGYRFLGWFTSAALGEGIAVDENSIYSLTADSTIYAQWEKKEISVTYNYWANGGTKINTEHGKNVFQVQYKEPVDLNIAAVKEDWVHIGWNTQQNATEPLKAPFYISEEPVELYAIYKKDITLTYIDKKENLTDIRKDMKTIYNQETEAVFCLMEQNLWSGWQQEGWCIEETADAFVYEVAGKNLGIQEDLTLYGKYSKEVSISYDTNGSGQEFPTETKTRYYNAFGTFENPIFLLAQAPVLEQNSFAGWIKSQDLEQKEQGSQQVEKYTAGQGVELEENTTFVAWWDEFPKIEAYDRYFTLEHAKQGIDSLTLLQGVKGTDKEDQELENGRDVIVLYYDPEEVKSFTTDGSVSVTYQATDSFGNVVTKLVMVHIVDTTIRSSKEQEYVRFINDNFYKVNQEYVEFEKGGLEENSVWKENSVYTELLDYALSNQKTREITVSQEFLGTIREVIKPGTGVWEHQVETWTFSKEQIEAVKMLISRKGYGKYQNMTGIQEFCQQFSGCRE